MAFVDPNAVHNPATGTAAPAAWGDTVRDSLFAVQNVPLVRVHRTTTMSITTATETPVLFDTELIDTHGMHSTAALTDRLTVPTGWAGYWNIRAGYRWAPTVSGGTRRYFRLKINASIIIASTDVDVGGSGYAEGQVACIWGGAPGDYFTVSGYQDSTGNLDLQADGYAGTFFEAFFIGAGGVG